MPFDPGIREAYLSALNGDNGMVKNMRYDGVCIVEDIEIPLHDVLFDPGALHRSYLSKQWLSAHRDVLQDCIYPVDAVVRLGDNSTVKPVSERCNLTLSFVDHELTEHKATVTCDVIDMPGMSVILGLPDLVRYFFDFTVVLFTKARNNVLDTEYEESLHAMDPTYPWSNAPALPAPE